MGSASLVVELYSFSYKVGIPGTDSEHGGGFYFDCRCLKNPGREAQYRTLTGLDASVISYLEAMPELETFWQSTAALVVQAVEAYQDRGFESLVVGYGCTGGQHRSVYCAERLKAYLGDTCKVKVTLTHCQSTKWPAVKE